MPEETQKIRMNERTWCASSQKKKKETFNFLCVGFAFFSLILCVGLSSTCSTRFGNQIKCEAKKNYTKHTTEKRQVEKKEQTKKDSKRNDKTLKRKQFLFVVFSPFFYSFRHWISHWNGNYVIPIKIETKRERKIILEMKQGKWSDEDEYRLGLHVPQDVLFDNRL